MDYYSPPVRKKTFGYSAGELDPSQAKISSGHKMVLVNSGLGLSGPGMGGTGLGSLPSINLRK